MFGFVLRAAPALATLGGGAGLWLNAMAARLAAYGPICSTHGTAHCPQCVVAAGLAAVGIVRLLALARRSDRR